MTDDLPNKKAIGSELMQGTRSARRGINFLVFVGVFCSFASWCRWRTWAGHL